MPADPQRVKAVFMAASEAAMADQPALLDRECGDDADLRQRVEALLQAQAEPGSFLGGPHRGDTAAFQPIPGLAIGGTFAGRFKVREELGAGGMGVVFVADQTEPVQRRVALKVIRTGADSARVLARFEQERQALALMDHPNIAKVLDAGVSETGQPYFVMELIKGVPLTKYCDETKLTPRERLELFIPVCQAVQHAHQKGIIHRDLKPSNILVGLYDGKPVPKVIDFGVAKATGPRISENSIYTEVGSVIGTFEYMSPEQAELNNLDVDTRSDIYALGVILYELLTGTVPFSRKQLESAGFAEMLRVIKEDEPPKPSTRLSGSKELKNVAASRHTEPAKLSKLVRGDLDWITMKALEKDRARRYETANGLARDIQRFLNDEPVEACPPSALYRARKFARKNRAALLAAGLVTLALVAGTTVSTWQAMLARKAEHAARQAAEAEARERLRAEDHERQAIASAVAEKEAKEKAQLRLKQVEKGNEILSSIFADLDPEAEEIGGQPLGATLAKQLDRAAAILDAEAIGDTLTVARLQRTLGESLYHLGDDRKATELLEKAVATLTSELGERHEETLNARFHLGAVHRASGRLNTAITMIQQALQVAESALGDDHLVTLKLRDQLGVALNNDGRLEQAIPLLERALAGREAKLGDGHEDTVMSRNNLASAFDSAGKTKSAVPLHERNVRAYEQSKGIDHPRTIWVRQNLAMACRVAGDLDRALSLCKQSLQACEAKFGDEHPQTLSVRNGLGTIFMARGQLDEAAALLERTLCAQEAKLGADHPNTLSTRSNLAHAYSAIGKRPLALELMQVTAKAIEAKYGPDHPQTLQARANLAADYFHDGQWDRAIVLLEPTLRAVEIKLGADHPQTLSTRNNLAAVYLAAGRVQPAIALHEHNLQLSEAKLGFNHPGTLQTANNLACALLDGGKLPEALRLHERTLEARTAKLGEDHPDTQESMHNTALAYRRNGQLDRALPLHERTLAVARKKLGAEHPDLVFYLKGLAGGYRDVNRLDEAIPLFEEARRLAEAHLGRDHPNTLEALNDLAVAYQRAGRLPDALPLMEESLARQSIKPGREHPHTLVTMGNLAMALLRSAQIERSLALHSEFVAIHRKQAGAEDPRFAGLLAQVAGELAKHHQDAEAEKYYRECLAIREKKQPDVWTTFYAKSALGGALLGQKKTRDAEPLLLAGYGGLNQRAQQIPPAFRTVRLAEALERLVQLYEAKNKPDEAAKWRKELEALHADATMPPKP
jgi:tetratricopeptide (TPR) repeat protein/predicted Ser/Thr protein kinase